MTHCDILQNIAFFFFKLTVKNPKVGLKKKSNNYIREAGTSKVLECFCVEKKNEMTN